MNKIFTYTIYLAFCSALLISCAQDIELDPNANTAENEIVFQTADPTTRGLINNLGTPGTKITLYGYHGDTPLAYGQDKVLLGKYLTYTTINGNNQWAVMDDAGNRLTYFWEGEDDKPYRFFGWLNYDATGLSFPSEWTYNTETKTFTIPEGTVLDKDYNQFDFLYSFVDERILSPDNKRTPVTMNMNHLFTAFGIGITNTSEDNITVKSVTLKTIHDKGSATIGFSPNLPNQVSYGATSRTDDNAPFISYSNSTGYIVYNDESGNPNVKNNIFNPDATAKEYYIVWPQAEDVFPELTFANDEAEANEPDSSFPLILEYEANGQPIKKRMQLPKMAWEPGKLYYFDILVADKLVEIITTVKDWNYFTSNIDFNENTIEVKENNHLTWDPNTCTVDDTGKKVYIKNGQPAEGTFTIDAPVGGQWRASLEGDITAFEILDDTAPIDDGFGPIDGTQHRIRVRPLIDDPDRDYSVRVKFVAVTAGGKTYPADDMLQDVNDDKKADPFTIILESTR